MHLTTQWKRDLVVAVSQNKDVLWQSAHLPTAWPGSSWVLSFQGIVERECMIMNHGRGKKRKCAAVA